MERLSQIYVDRRMRYVSRSVWILECDEWYVSSDFLITFTSIFFPATLNLAQAFYGSTAFNYPASSSPTPTTKFSNVTLKICKKFISLRKFTPICELSVPLSRSGSKDLKRKRTASVAYDLRLKHNYVLGIQATLYYMNWTELLPHKGNVPSATVADRTLKRLCLHVCRVHFVNSTSSHDVTAAILVFQNNERNGGHIGVPNKSCRG